MLHLEIYFSILNYTFEIWSPNLNCWLDPKMYPSHENQLCQTSKCPYCVQEMSRTYQDYVY